MVDKNDSFFKDLCKIKTILLENLIFHGLESIINFTWES